MKKKDKILIIGNQGYVGSVLVKFLKKIIHQSMVLTQEYFLKF